MYIKIEILLSKIKLWQSFKKKSKAHSTNLTAMVLPLCVSCPQHVIIIQSYFLKRFPRLRTLACGLNIRPGPSFCSLLRPAHADLAHFEHAHASEYVKPTQTWFHVSFGKTCVPGGESQSHQVADPPPEAGRAWRASEDAQAPGSC